MTDPGVAIRRGLSSDLAAAAHLLASVRRASFPAIPKSVHDDDVELEPYLDDLCQHGAEVLLAMRDHHLIGVLVLRGSVIEQLAVVPAEHGKGVGRSLVDAALERSVQPLTLWTFQSNVSAQGFYRHLGFTEIDRTDGDNEEGEPDVRFSSAPALLGQGEGAVGSQGS